MVVDKDSREFPKECVTLAGGRGIVGGIARFRAISAVVDSVRSGDPIRWRDGGSLSRPQGNVIDFR